MPLHIVLSAAMAIAVIAVLAIIISGGKAFFLPDPEDTDE